MLYCTAQLTLMEAFGNHGDILISAEDPRLYFFDVFCHGRNLSPSFVQMEKKISEIPIKEKD